MLLGFRLDIYYQTSSWLSGTSSKIIKLVTEEIKIQKSWDCTHSTSPGGLSEDFSKIAVTFLETVNYVE
jgi:hypothetical protein